MDTRQIEYILAIAKEQSITKAAQKLYITQPTLSQALAKLEQELGQTLFERQHGKVQPTAAGLEYIHTAKQMMQLKYQLYQKLHSQTESQHFSLGACSRWGLELLSVSIPRFKKAYKYPVFFHITDGSPSRCIEKILDNTLDMAIVTAEYANQFPNAEVLYAEELLLAVPKNAETEALFSSGELSDAAKVISALPAYPFILAEQKTSLRALEDAFFLSNGFSPEAVCEIRDMTASLHLTAHEIGLSFIPESRKEELPVYYFSASPKIYRYHTLIIQRELCANPLYQRFISEIKAVSGEYFQK